MSKPSETVLPLNERQAHETVQEWVYQQLREAIMTGYFVPGRSVTLRGVAAMLNVSLMPVREALRRLVAERALQALSNRRVTVPQLSQTRLTELCEVRIRLETLAAEKALPNIDAECLERLRRIDGEVDAALAQKQAENYLCKNQEFHFTLYRSSASQVLIPMIENLWLQFGPFMRMALNHIDMHYMVDRHREALAAIAAKDSEALCRAIEADIRDGMGKLREEEWRDLYQDKSSHA